MVALALIGSAFAMTACGNGNGNGTAAASASASAPVTAPSADPIEKSTPTPTPEEEKSSRGNFLIKAGSKQFATETDQISNEMTAKFFVDKITVDAPCTGAYPQPSENGHLVHVRVTAQTTPALAKASFPKFTFSSNDFKFIAKNGTTFNGHLGTGATFGCIPDTEMFPSGGLGPDEKASGVIVLDVPPAPRHACRQG